MTDKERGLAIAEAFRTSQFFEQHYGTTEAETESILNILTERIKDIEQGPCEDCISREYALKMFAEKCAGECGCCEYNGSGYDTAENCKLIKSLPPVTPQPKTGHWIRMKAYEKWGCSECHTVFRFTFKEHDYCPNCGAKMVEPQTQESEDKG